MSAVLALAAPVSGAGKTVLTLALLRAFRDRGVAVAAAKSGPDYIDPQFHEAACGAPSVNLDAWAMAPGALRARAAAQGGDLLLVEGAMGALDGAAPDGRGSTADLAAALGAPLVMTLDISRSAQSAALPLAGLRALRPEPPIAGAILNRAGSERHASTARRAVEAAGFAVFGAVPRHPALETPSRHLGLVQARERADLDAFVARAAEIVARSVDLDALAAAAAPLPAGGAARGLPPLGQRVAIARDAAFAFAYPHMLADWRAAGAALASFSPLADEGPPEDADAVFLPGGYPELHAARLAAAERFRGAMRSAAARGALIYGECGGYMTLGEALVDGEGVARPMLGLLPVVTSFAQRRRALGYRVLTPKPGAPWATALAGHEHHRSTVVREGAAERLFSATDAAGAPLGEIGLRVGRVCGSYAHAIAPSP